VDHAQRPICLFAFPSHTLIRAVLN
jgi:hypothetical protein